MATNSPAPASPHRTPHTGHSNSGVASSRHLFPARPCDPPPDPSPLRPPSTALRWTGKKSRSDRTCDATFPPSVAFVLFAYAYVDVSDTKVPALASACSMSASRLYSLPRPQHTMGSRRGSPDSAQCDHLARLRSAGSARRRPVWTFPAESWPPRDDVEAPPSAFATSHD